MKILERVRVQGSAASGVAALAPVLGLLGALALAMAADAANLRNHIEAVRHGAAVVYLGVVEAVEATERERDRRLLAATRVRVLFVARSPTGEVPAADTLEYPTWDDEHPPYAGDGQYRIEPGAFLAVFRKSWGGEVRYLLQGTPGELLQDLERRRSWLADLSEEGLRREEIDEEGRRTQLELYRRLAARLESAMADGSAPG